MIHGLTAKNLKPKFLADNEGNLFIQISVGNSTLVRPIPPMVSMEDAREHIDKLVPDMAKELYRRRRNKLKRTRKSK